MKYVSELLAFLTLEIRKNRGAVCFVLLSRSNNVVGLLNPKPAGRSARNLAARVAADNPTAACGARRGRLASDNVQRLCFLFAPDTNVFVNQRFFCPRLFFVCQLRRFG